MNTTTLLSSSGYPCGVKFCVKFGFLVGVMVCALAGVGQSASLSFTTGEQHFTGLGLENGTFTGEYDWLDVNSYTSSGNVDLTGTTPVTVNPFTFTVGVNASSGGTYNYLTARSFTAFLTDTDGTTMRSASLMQPFSVNISSLDTLTFSAGAPLALNFGLGRILTITPQATALPPQPVGATNGTLTALMQLSLNPRLDRTWSGDAGTWDVNSTQSWVQGDNLFFQSDSVTFDDLASGKITNVSITGNVQPSTINVNNTLAGVAKYTFSGPGIIEGITSLIKEGNGVLELTSPNTYSGPTTVVGGTLLVSNATGSATGTGDVAVQQGAVLGGTGIILGRVDVSGTIFPSAGGTGPTVLTTGAQNWNAGGGYCVGFINATASPGIGCDLLVINGPIQLSDGFKIQPVGNSVPANALPDTLYSLTITSATSFSLGSPLPTLDTQYWNAPGTFSLAIQPNGSRQDLVLQYEYSSVPEPSTLLLALTGAWYAIVARRRRKISRAAR